LIVKKLLKNIKIFFSLKKMVYLYIENNQNKKNKKIKK